MKHYFLVELKKKFFFKKIVLLQFSLIIISFPKIATLKGILDLIGPLLPTPNQPLVELRLLLDQPESARGQRLDTHPTLADRDDGAHGGQQAAEQAGKASIYL